MKKMNPTILTLSESRLIPEIVDSEVNVPRYSVVRCDSENRNIGEIILYIRDDIKYEIILREKMISNCWCAAVEMKDKVIAVYHSPRTSDGDFIRFFRGYSGYIGNERTMCTDRGF